MAIEENIVEIRTILPEEVRLVAVTKTRTVDEIKTVYNMGITDFGENKVQELLEKYESFGNDVRWHLIGHLQRNKVKYIVGKVFLIHSLDSIKLLEEIERQYLKADKFADVLIEVNIGRESSKTGILVENLEELIDAVEKCSHVRVKGIMVIIPQGDSVSAKTYFREAREIWEDLKSKNLKNVSMEYLSMGMTHDYKIAIQEGSNMVRIGEGIFGKRIYNIK